MFLALYVVFSWFSGLVVVNPFPRHRASVRSGPSRLFSAASFFTGDLMMVRLFCVYLGFVHYLALRSNSSVNSVVFAVSWSCSWGVDVGVPLKWTSPRVMVDFVPPSSATGTLVSYFLRALQFFPCRVRPSWLCLQPGRPVPVASCNMLRCRACCSFLLVDE